MWTPVVVNSKDRVSGSTGNFTVNILRTLNRVQKIKFKGLLLPVGFYNIRSGRNTVTFTSSAVAYTATLPVGNYTSTSSALTALQTALNSASSVVWTATSSNLTGLVTLTANSSVTISSSSLLLNMLGFGTLYSSGGSGTSFVGDSPNNLSESMVYITINNISSNAISTSGIPFSFFVSLTSTFGTLSQFYESAGYFYTLDTAGTSPTFSSLQVTLKDEYGNALDNLGLNWTMVLEIESDC
jgi:hypothetical protein